MNACGNVRRPSRRGLLPLFSLCCVALATLPAQGAPPAGTRELDDLRYVLGGEWVVEDLRGGGPELRAHYAMKVRGQPCGELYVSSELVARGQTLEQVLQAGIEKTRDKLPDYQPLGTKRTKAGDFDAVVHDFGYTVGVPFRGRVYVLLAGGSSYSFFFNTTGSYFAAVEGTFTKVMASVKRRERPAVPVADAGPTTVEEHGLLIDLPAGWRPSGDAAGAKYRCFGPQGETLASFFPMCSNAPILAAFGPIDAQIDGFVQQQQDDLGRQFERATFAPVRRLDVGGISVRCLDCDCEQAGIQGFFRWFFLPVKDKPDEGTVQYGWTIRQFGFFATRDARLDAKKAQFDDIIKTVRTKNAAAAAPPATGDLPALEPEAEPAARFRDAAARFELPLPEGAKQESRAAALAVYAIAAKAARIELHCLPSAAEAVAKVDAIAAGKKANGKEMTWQVGGKEAVVRLYTHKDAAGEPLATLVARYPEVALVVVVELPAKGYGDGQAWITPFLKGLRYPG